MKTGRFDHLLAPLMGRLIISCQDYIETMIPAAIQGGAAGLRINGPSDVRFARSRTDLPILGCNKVFFPNCDMYITPSCRTAMALIRSGADIIAMDARAVRRPRESLKDLIAMVHGEDRPVVADVSCFDEASTAVQAGADIVATTFAADFSADLVREFATLDVPVLAEGHVNSPERVAAAVEAGAWSVCVGTAITRPHLVADWFRQSLT